MLYLKYYAKKYQVILPCFKVSTKLYMIIFILICIDTFTSHHLVTFISTVHCHKFCTLSYSVRISWRKWASCTWLVSTEQTPPKLIVWYFNLNNLKNMGSELYMYSSQLY